MTKKLDETNSDGEDVEGQQQQYAEEDQLIPQAGAAAAAKKRTSTLLPKNNAAALSATKKSTRSNRPRSTTSKSSNPAIVKYGALVLLVGQMVGLVLLMRYSRTHHDPSVPLYVSSTAVLVMEVMKLMICLVVVSLQSYQGLVAELNQHVLRAPLEMAKLCVPSFLYTVQNNLLYYALSNLDAATYQVCYQLKILTTAIFSVALLGRKFSPIKWFSLIVLTVGVAIVEVSGTKDSTPADDSLPTQHRTMGLVAVLCAACTSGFSGVYFERILKGSSTSLWVRNVQMGIPSVILAASTVVLTDGALIAQQGFWTGYTPIVWTVVSIQAAGGLLVAVVVKYADNVLKVFATSFSIVVSCVLSAIWLDFQATPAFVVGASLVVVATGLYSKPEGRSRRSARTLRATKKGGQASLLPTTTATIQDTKQ